MPKAIVTITIQPFVAPFVSTATPPTVMQPYDIANTSDPANWIVVTRPKGPNTALGGVEPYVPGRIAVSGNTNAHMDLTFHVVDNASSPGQYIVAGLLFSKMADALRALPPETGRNIFTEFTCNSVGELTVHDTRAAAGNYNFLLLIQNRYGGVGIVDPQISNV